MISFLQHSYISFYCSDIINLFLLDYTWYGLCNIRCSTISTHAFSVVPAFFEDISTLSLLKPIKWLKQCKYHPCLSRLASMIQYYKVGKIFEFTVFIFLENALNFGVFTHDTPPPPNPQSPIPNPYSKLSLKFLSSHPRQREITHSPRQHFFENLFLPTAEGLQETKLLNYH